MASKASVSLFKRGWNEIPEVMGGTFMALVGVGLAVTGLAVYKAKDGDNRRHKFDYIVVRPDDPIAKTLRKD